MLFLGFTDETIKWYTSCLSNRKLIISMENAYSNKPTIITCGVPQGSILDPLFFLIYINDIPQVFFSPKDRSKSTGQIDISYKDVKIKQYSKITYLGSVLDECLTGESMAM